jgi:hypothetical protein
MGCQYDNMKLQSQVYDHLATLELGYRRAHQDRAK